MSVVIPTKNRRSLLTTTLSRVLDELHLIEQLSTDLRDGRPIDPAWFHKWMGVSMMRGGDRRGAAGAFWRQATVRRPGPALRALGCLVVPASGWALARRVKISGTDPLETPPWLAGLLDAERERSVAAGAAGPGRDDGGASSGHHRRLTAATAE